MANDLTSYFNDLIKKVEASDLSNAGKDKDGFYKPTRELVLRNLHLLRDLHQKPLAKPMVKDAWKFVVENLPPEMLVLGDEDKAKLKEILK
jgi:hypothetical protein